jgi:hypothetical protein
MKQLKVFETAVRNSHSDFINKMMKGDGNDFPLLSNHSNSQTQTQNCSLLNNFYEVNLYVGVIFRFEDFKTLLDKKYNKITSAQYVTIGNYYPISINLPSTSIFVYKKFKMPMVAKLKGANHIPLESSLSYTSYLNSLLIQNNVNLIEQDKKLKKLVKEIFLTEFVPTETSLIKFLK